MVVAAETGSEAVMYLAFLVWGLGFGGGIPLSEFIWAKYYGRRYLGAVRSVGVPFGIVFGASGGLLLARYYDVVGNYRGAWLALTGVCLVGVCLIAVSREPRRKVVAPST